MPKNRQCGGDLSVQTHPQKIQFASIATNLPKFPTRRQQRSLAKACRDSPENPIFEIGAVATVPRLSPVELAHRRPIVLLSMVPKPLVLFSAGALSGAIAKTITAPLDRVKILLQVSGGFQGGAIGKAAKQGNLIESLIAVGKQEGIKGYWKGNLPQVLRVVPYSAAQLYSYEVFKQRFADENGSLSVQKRLLAGAAAGMTATLVRKKEKIKRKTDGTFFIKKCILTFVFSFILMQLTHPLDTLRLRLAVDPGCKNLAAAVRVLAREGGFPAFYRGLGASMFGIAPYMALELACYDLLPKEMPSFGRGFSSALIATVTCYPLDTIRRRIQLVSASALPATTAISNILKQDGIGGLYRGFLPNAIKNLPNKGVKLTVFDTAKKALVAAELALDEERLAIGLPALMKA